MSRRHSRSMISRRLARRRHGAVMIEFALCLPVFLAILQGTLETCQLMYLRQSAKIAAYECARLAIVPDATQQALLDQADIILMGRGIEGYEVDVSEEDFDELEFGDMLTVNVQISADENTLTGAWFSQGKIITESVTIMAEF